MVEYAADGQRERHIIPDGQRDPLGRVVLAVGRGYGHGAGHIKDDGHDKAQRLRFADDLRQQDGQTLADADGLGVEGGGRHIAVAVQRVDDTQQ